MHHMEFITVHIFYSNRDRQTNMFRIRPYLTTLKEGMKILSKHK